MSRAIENIARYRAYRIYAILIILHVALVWIIPHFPTQDGPSHVYNLVILHDLVNGGTDWGQYFTYSLHAVPNLGFHLVAYPLITLFSPYVAERLFVSIYILLMTVSVPILIRAFGNQPLPLSFLVFPLLFNYPFMMGFYSFAIAVPCMLLAISSAWHFRSATLTRRFLVLNLAGLVLFYLHLIPFIIYLLTVCIMLTVPAIGHERPYWNLLFRPVIIAPVMMLCLFYLYNSRQGSQALVSYTISWSRFQELLGSLLVFSLDTYSVWQLAAWLPLFLLLYMLAKAGWKEREESPELCVRNRTLVPLLLALLFIYFSLPVDFGGGDFFNQRLPWILAILSLPLLKIPSSGPIHRFQKSIFPGIALLFLSMNSVILLQQSNRVGEFLAGMQADIPQGAFIATYKHVTKGWSRVDPLLHAASHYGIGKQCIDAGNYELASGISFVHFRGTAPLLPRHDLIAFYPEQIDWARYPAVRFLLAWDIAFGSGQCPVKDFSLSMKEGRFSLWRREQRQADHPTGAPESQPQ